MWSLLYKRAIVQPLQPTLKGYVRQFTRFIDQKNSSQCYLKTHLNLFSLPWDKCV